MTQNSHCVASVINCFAANCCASNCCAWSGCAASAIVWSNWHATDSNWQAATVSGQPICREMKPLGAPCVGHLITREIHRTAVSNWHSFGKRVRQATITRDWQESETVCNGQAMDCTRPILSLKICPGSTPPAADSTSQTLVPQMAICETWHRGPASVWQRAGTAVNR